MPLKDICKIFCEYKPIFSFKQKIGICPFNLSVCIANGLKQNTKGFSCRFEVSGEKLISVKIIE